MAYLCYCWELPVLITLYGRLELGRAIRWIIRVTWFHNVSCYHCFRGLTASFAVCPDFVTKLLSGKHCTKVIVCSYWLFKMKEQLMEQHLSAHALAIARKKNVNLRSLAEDWRDWAISCFKRKKLKYDIKQMKKWMINGKQFSSFFRWQRVMGSEWEDCKGRSPGKN